MFQFNYTKVGWLFLYFIVIFCFIMSCNPALFLCLRCFAQGYILVNKELII
nr:MAG TPA: hypothetical protein [Caudoviricetes sp.]